MENPILDLGITIVLFLQSMGEQLAGLMQFLSFFGDEEFFLMVMPILYWSLDAAIGLRVGLILLISSGLNHTLKLVFHSPRPFYYDEAVRAFDNETTFGIPSGHAQNSASVWGLLAALVSRSLPAFGKIAWAAALLLTFLIGLSRLYVGMHFPTDVLMGWAVGFALVWVFLKLEAPITNRFRNQPLSTSILAIFGASLVLILLDVLARLSLGAWSVPQGWIDTAALTRPDVVPHPLAMEGIFTSAGAMFGLGAGALWMRSSGGFSASGTPWKRLARYPIGVIGVAILWFGLGEIFPREEALFSYTLRYIRYALVGLWISALAPMLFIRLGLARGEDSKQPVQAAPASSSSQQ